jgi:hypothetical protein
MLGIFLIICIVGLVITLLLDTKNPFSIPHIIAGDADTVVNVDQSLLRSKFTLFLDKDLILRPKETFIGRVVGNSMEMRGLTYDDLVIGRKVNPTKSDLKKGDLVVILISDTERKGFGKLKIREFDHYIDEKLIQTIKYQNGLAENSTPHNLIDVIAVVDRFVRSDKLLKTVAVVA